MVPTSAYCAHVVQQAAQVIGGIVINIWAQQHLCKLIDGSQIPEIITKRKD